MAADLNPPSHFLGKPPVIPSTEPVLLPPSSFESSHQTIDAWTALAQATGEILDLKEQNIKLQERKNITIPVGEEIRAHVDLHKHEPDPVKPTSYGTPENSQLKHYHDIISHQAADIVQLREQLVQSAAKYEKQIAQLEGQLLLKESHHAQQLAGLEERLKLISEQYETEISKLQTAKSKCEEDHMTAASQWHDELESNKEQFMAEINQLKKELQDTQHEYVVMETELTNKIREKDLLLEEQSRTVSQLKTYLSENPTQSTEIWKRDLDNLKRKLEDTEIERNKLASEVDLLNIRLKSLNDLMVLHEKEISKVKQSSTDKKRHCLLTRWREKVFELLVQLKCTELAHDDEKRNWTNKLHGVENELEQCRIELNRTKCVVQDKQAQLDIENNNNKMLERELTRAQQLAIMLDDKIKNNETTMVQIADYINSVQHVVCNMESKHKEVASTLSSYCQRLAYASGRIEVLQGQFARKEALIRLELEEALQEHPTRDRELEMDTTNKSAEAQLRAELAKVIEERDTLAAQIKSDAKMLENKVMAAKQQVAEEVNLLKLRTEELHMKLEEKNHEADYLREQLKEAQQELDECRETVDGLKLKLAQLDAKSQQDKESACAALESQFTEQLAVMEQKLNDARREQTKTVVALRQMEREVNREKKRHTDHIATLEQYYKQEVSKLEQKLLTADKDRNLLMATLRQEGLIGKYRAQLLPPGVGSSETEPGHEASYQKRALNELEDVSATDEPLHAVIDDVKSLTKAILEDTDEDSEEDVRIRHHREDKRSLAADE